MAPVRPGLGRSENRPEGLLIVSMEFSGKLPLAASQVLKYGPPDSQNSKELVVVKKQLWGLIFVVLGVLILLQVLEIFNFGLTFWPTVLLLLAILIISESISHGIISWLTLGVGLWIGGIGLFNILSNIGWITVSGSEVARFGWPLILVAIGLSILLGDRNYFPRGMFSKDTGSEDFKKSGKRVHHLGDLYHGRAPWVLDQDLQFFHGIGDVVIDFTTAEVKPGNHRVFVKAGIGDVTIKVPGGVNIDIDAFVGLGELDVFGEQRSGIGGLSLQRSIKAEDSAATILVEAKMGLGDMKVLYSPAVPGA